MTVWVEIGGRTSRVSLRPDGSAEVDGAPITVDARVLEPGILSLLVDGLSYRCVAQTIGESSSVIIDGQRFPYSLQDPRSLRGMAGSARGAVGTKTLKAPMPGRVVRVPVGVGDVVQAGQACVVIEAMKMQNELKATKAGTVARMNVEVDQTVAAGEILLVIEMSVPEGALPAYFAPQQVGRVFAAGEVLFLVDTTRLGELGGTSAVRNLGTERRPSPALVAGAVVPAIGLEPGYYTVLVRSTETEGAMMPLAQIVFSAGFVLGTEPGELAIWSADQVSGASREETTAARLVHVTPGWYSVTVVAGVRLDDDGAETEEWVLCFLLDPQSSQPEFTGDVAKTLGFFG